MDSLAPPLRALLEIKLKVQTGSSVRAAIKEYTTEFKSEPFARDLQQWLFNREAGGGALIKPFQGYTYRKLLIEVLARGLEGGAVLKPLLALEEELISASQIDMDRQLKKLPLTAMIPLLLLQLPAFLILVFGPLLLRLMDQLNL